MRQRGRQPYAAFAKVTRTPFTGQEPDGPIDRLVGVSADSELNDRVEIINLTRHVPADVWQQGHRWGDRAQQRRHLDAFAEKNLQCASEVSVGQCSPSAQHRRRLTQREIDKRCRWFIQNGTRERSRIGGQRFERHDRTRGVPDDDTGLTQPAGDGQTSDTWSAIAVSTRTGTSSR